MNKSKYEMEDLAKEGASLMFDVSDFSEYEIRSIAEAIQDGCTLELQGCDSNSLNELKAIAQSAPGKVKFIFCEE